MPSSTSSRTAKYVALLRGINLGSRNRLAMPALVELFEAAGCLDVITYVQSGNIVFRADKPLVDALPESLSGSIAARFGFKVPVVIRSASEMARVAHSNPFLAPDIAPQALHVYFLAQNPAPARVATLDPDRSPPDAFRVIGKEIYIHLPNGMGRSKLTNAYFDSRLGTISTARNWATVCKLRELTAPLG